MTLHGWSHIGIRQAHGRRQLRSLMYVLRFHRCRTEKARLFFVFLVPDLFPLIFKNKN